MGDGAQAADYVRSLIEKHHPRAKTVLELACGTGSVLAQLLPHYEVAGADLSSPMLELASRKLPDVRLFHEDMTRIALGERFDVVLCVFDSINHLLRFGEWEEVFDRAAEHLEPGGIFVFDVNTVAKLEAFAAARPVPVWFDDNLLVVDVTDRGDGLSTWEIRIFEHVGGADYRLHAEDIFETAFPLDRIRASLDDRYARVWVYDAERTRPSARSERLHFVCRAAAG